MRWARHCAGRYRGGNQTAVSADPEHDAVSAALDWAEHGVAPQQLVATKFNNNDPTQGMLAAQLIAGIDIPNDGEFGKPMRSASDLAAWGTYIFNRISGFGPTSPDAAAPDRALLGEPMRIIGMRWEQREFSEFYAESGLGISTTASRPTCTGPITYTENDALRRDLANLKAATDAKGVEEAFVTSIAPGSLETFCRAQNSHYPTAEGFLEAIATALGVECRAIVDAGFTPQLDDPGLPDTWDMLEPQPSIQEYKRYAMLRIEALNRTLAGCGKRSRIRRICCLQWPLRDEMLGDVRSAVGMPGQKRCLAT